MTERSSSSMERSSDQEEISTRTRRISKKDITPIAQLTPELRNWTIVAKVSSKTPITLSESGVVYMHVILLDSSGEILAKFFRDVCYQFDKSLKVGKQYFISRAALIRSNPSYNPVHPFEMVFNNASVVRPAVGVEIPQLSERFTPLSKLSTVPLNSEVDVIGVATDISDLSLATFENKREFWSRKVTLTDASKAQVLVSLWGQRALNFGSDQPNPIVAIKNAKLVDNKEVVMLSVTSRSVMEIDPEIAVAQELRNWFAAEEFSDEDPDSPNKRFRSE